MNLEQDKIQQTLIEFGVKHFKKHRKGYYDLSIRMGKTKISLELLKKLYSNNCTILIAYPDNKLKDTWENECKLWDYSNPNIIHVNFSSLHKFKDIAVDMFIIDEFHAASVNEFELCQIISSNAEKTLCLSGTVAEDTRNLWNIPEIAKYSTDQGIEDGILADYKITIHVVDLDNKVKFANKKSNMVTEKEQYDNYTWVINNMKNSGKSSMFLALARNRLSLNSIGKVEYVRNLLTKLVDKRVLVFTGQTKAADSLGIPSYHTLSKDKSTFDAFLNGEIQQLALAGIGKVGVTYPALDSVILSNFSYNEKESAQILNRCIKLDYVNKVADMHVIVLNEDAELKKVKASLKLLNKDKIFYNVKN